ncbi:MAG: glycyl-radical enzyme activating protein [Anaerolineae bacterium]|nr:glycyl-radical enzyme activating protein [Anaerolineae bacterium]
MTSHAENLLGRILHLQRLSTEDGPGIRTTVFFKGCPLSCAWCHNPESIAPYPQVQWLEQRCMGCQTCVAACPRGCLRMTGAGIVIDRTCCTGCGVCAEACPTQAMELLGRQVDVAWLVGEVLKDCVYFETSGGGVTVSGGEPAAQPGFVAAFLAEMRAAGVPTALDTCGLCSQTVLETLLPYVDLVLFDLKLMDPVQHQLFTGQSNARILDNLCFIRDYIKNDAPDLKLWIRTPLIPGATATGENLTHIGAFIAANLDGWVQRWELCAFNNLCRDKYRRLGLTWPFAGMPLMTAGELSALETVAKASGVPPDSVLATGATRGQSDQMTK